MTTPVKSLGVVGSRSLGDNKAAMDEAGWILTIALEKHPEIVSLYSGGAKGPDTLAANVAKLRGLTMIVFKPEPEKYSGSFGAAAYARNELIVCNSNLVMAFWDGASPGTANDIALCRKHNKPCVLYTWNGHGYERSRPV
jgi:hypothetical protein